ncbi:alcohol dehydrogenase catalytic domain-containing protein [Streptomyces murinus]|uniref:alcohol dehydrogenase catalytic domain-containing protein n=1 Tax=Streptomyces TaxID=1883 RepID=UPI002E1102C5|nr:alcohol dehydrogenase catalytic domain-containing protein [Streptomyces murinus]
MTTALHRAIVRQGHRVRVELRPTPRPVGGELLLAPQTAGLCGTDLQMLRGLRGDPAPVIGHEGAALVVAAGPGADPALAPGTRVVVNPTHPEDPSFLLGHHLDGLLQERTLIPETAVRAGLVMPLPGPLAPDDLAALLEPLATVHYAFSVLKRARIRTLLVFGDGTVGHLAVRAADRVLGPGVRTVHVHHTDAGRAWSEARAHRADRLLTAADDPYPLRAAVGDGPVAVLLATPRDATLRCLETALRAVPGELTVDLLGGLPSDAASPLLPGVELAAVRAANCGGRPSPARVAHAVTDTGRRIRLFGHRGVAGGHLRDAARELAAAPERYRDLVTHVAGLDEAAEIMGHLALHRDRTWRGRRLVKLAVRVAADRTRPTVAA